ncbi:MAG: TonB-dependent receptor, partial [Burkholderiales bacterium]|nr:TonB-dependent receptor [Burkholderiales bacterium]
GGYPVENISRIEIIRWPGSALYGADAYVGVINIVTKSGAEMKGTRVGARVGTPGVRDAWVEHGSKFGSVDVGAYLRVGKTNGVNRTVDFDGQSAIDLGANTHASLAPGPVNAGAGSFDANLDFSFENWRLRLSEKYRHDVGTGIGAADALDPVGKSKSNRTHVDLSWFNSQIAKDWGAGFSASVLRYIDNTDPAFRVFPPGTQLGPGLFPDGMLGAPSTYERQIRISAYATYSGFQNHTVRFGVGHDDLNMYKTTEFKNFDLTSYGLPVPIGQLVDVSNTAPFILPKVRKVNYLYVQDEWNFLRGWTLTAGLRHDRFSDVGGTTNPRLALVWDAAVNVTAKLLYGQAFRAPSFNEVAGVNNPVLKGNPKLRPETIRTLE